MITKIVAQNFKGLNFVTEIGKHNLILGATGSGKSAIPQAFMLAVMGYIPGIDVKTNSDILDTFGTNGNLAVGFFVETKSFGRMFTRSAKGTVTQTYKVDGLKVKKDDYIAGMATAGRVNILDLQNFLDMSDQKQIDLLFSLFPPGEGLVSLQDEIVSNTEKKNNLETKIKGLETVVARLVERRSLMPMPAGSLLETQAGISIIEGKMEAARKNLESEKILVAERETKAKADEETKNKIESLKETVAQVVTGEPENKEVVEVLTKTPDEFANQPNGAGGGGGGSSGSVSSEKIDENPLGKKETAEEFAEKLDNLFTPGTTRKSIQLIMSTMESAGCSACAALLIAKRELKKYQTKDSEDIKF